MEILSRDLTLQGNNDLDLKSNNIIEIQSDTVQLSETNKRGHAAYLELGGFGYLSVNYELQFKLRNIISFALGWNDLEVKESKGGDSNPFLGVRGMYLHLFGSGPSYFEIGIGAAYGLLDLKYFEIHNEVRESKSSLNGVIGYRRQGNEGFLFRAGFTPVVTNGSIYPLIGLSFGYKF